MSDEELLTKWNKFVSVVGYEEALSRIIATKKVRPSTAERLCRMRYKPTRPSGRTREALLEVVGKKAS